MFSAVGWQSVRALASGKTSLNAFIALPSHSHIAVAPRFARLLLGLKQAIRNGIHDYRG